LTVSLRVQVNSGYASLPEAAAGVFDDPSAGGILRSREWLQNAEANGMRPGDRVRLYSVHDASGDEVLAVFPALYSRLYASHPGARVLHFTLPEDQDFAPLAGSGKVAPVGATAAVLEAIAAAGQAYDVIRVSPLPVAAPLAAEFGAALRSTGHFLQVYRHPSERFESVAGQSFKDYLAQRPRQLREVLDRHTRLMLQGGRGQFHFPCNRELLEASWGDVQRIIDAAPADSESEPLQHVATMMALSAHFGALRLGMMYLDGQPVAMQFWIVTAGVARCLRIWGAQGQPPFPVDDLLTQMIAVCLIDGDRVAELDFGAIDEDFASGWAPKVRERIGIAAFTPRTWRGLRGAMRHVAPQYARSLPGRLWRRVARSSSS